MEKSLAVEFATRTPPPRTAGSPSLSSLLLPDPEHRRHAHTHQLPELCLANCSSTTWRDCVFEEGHLSWLQNHM